MPGVPIWQRNYYEHVVRGENELNRIREYIANNPLQWEMDREKSVGDRRWIKTRPNHGRFDGDAIGGRV